MLTLLAGGHVIDPTHGIDAPGDVWIEDGHIVATPDRQPDERHDVAGCVVMAGGIDIHSHIAGVNVNTARLLLPELRQDGALACAPVAEVIGSLYAAMGFTTVVEPAISPHQALQAHLELAAIPFIDRAILGVMGNDDAVLELLHDNASATAIADTVARTLTGARALGLKVINPGAAAAFKSNVRTFGLDDAVPGLRRVLARHHPGDAGRGHRAGPAASRPSALQQPWRAGQCRDRAGHHRGRRRPPAASRTSAILRLWHRGRARLFLGRPAPGPRRWRRIRI